MNAVQPNASDGEEVFCRSCKQLLCIVPRDQITDVELTCHCGAQMRVTYSPQGWRDIRATDKARDAAMKVADAELRLARARGAYDRTRANAVASQNSDHIAATMERLIASLDSLHQTLHTIYAVNPVPSCDYECCRNRKASDE